MILSQRQILDRLRKYTVGSPKSLVITPLIYDKIGDVFDADSVDLRLGNYFLLPRVLDQPYFSPDKTSSTTLHDRVHVPLGEYLVVPAHQTVLGATLEFIKLPSDVSGQVLTKSSVARTFIVVETAPWIHPQYRGCLTLEIANVSNTPVLLYPGRTICQLVLMSLKDEPKSTKGVTGERKHKDDEPEANYFGPVYPEAPKFRNPEDDLLKLGIERVSSLKKIDLVRAGNRWIEE
jgi:dCTP deaminase